MGNDLEDQVPRVASVEKPETVAARFNSKDRPGTPVGHHRVAEELGVPDRGDVTVRDVGAPESVEGNASGRAEQAAVDVEGAVLDGERDLVVLPAGRITGPGRGPGQNTGGKVRRSASQKVEPCQSGVDIQPRYAQGVIVEPEGRGPIRVGVLEHSVPPAPGVTEPVFELLLELLVERADFGVSRRKIKRAGKVPGFGVAIALLRVPPAMQVRHDRHRARVRSGCRAESGT